MHLGVLGILLGILGFLLGYALRAVEDDKKTRVYFGLLDKDEAQKKQLWEELDIEMQADDLYFP